MGCSQVAGEMICSAPLPLTTNQVLLAIELKLGSRARLRVEGFDRENTSQVDFLTLHPRVPVANSVTDSRDYSRGMQILFQRRSENRLSGWIGYTLVFADVRYLSHDLPPPLNSLLVEVPYEPTDQDQRHSLNLFASYRLTPTLRVSGKNLFGSGFPASPMFSSTTYRLNPYERLDLRIDKSWPFQRWKLDLYGELLNATNHYNPRFEGIGTTSTNNSLQILTGEGLPITPTLGLAFDF